MPDVHADPEKLKELARTIEKSADQLQQVAQALGRAVEKSGWDDSERRKFEEDFKRTVKSLSQFIEQLKSQYAPDLKRKASSLEQYRGR